MIKLATPTLIIVGIVAASISGAANAKDTNGFKNQGIKKSDVLKQKDKRKVSKRRGAKNKRNVAKRVTRNNRNVVKNNRTTTKRVTTNTKTNVRNTRLNNTQKQQLTPKPQNTAAKNKDQYFECAKFSNIVLNACMADANRKKASTKPCLTHYQGNIQRCQAKFL